MAITINGSTGITSSEIADGTITTDDISSSDVKSLKSGRKNLIINGGFDVWQRGTSFTSNPGSFSADRWQAYTYTDSWASSPTAVERMSFSSGQTDVPGNPNYYLRMTGTSDGRYAYVKQHIEDVTQFSGVTCTLSFYAKSSSTFTFTGMVNQNFGSGGSSDVNKTTSSITTTTSWARYEKVITLSSISGKTVGSSSKLRVYIMDGNDLPSGVTLDIANVQLELGSVATDFEHRSYGEELALCQRYYQQTRNGTGISTNSTTSYLTVGYATTMRTTPTFGLTSGFALNDAGVNSTQSTAHIHMYDGGTDSAFVQMNNFSGLTTYRPTLSRMQGGYITLDAEL